MRELASIGFTGIRYRICLTNPCLALPLCRQSVAETAHGLIPIHSSSSGFIFESEDKALAVFYYHHPEFFISWPDAAAPVRLVEIQCSAFSPDCKVEIVWRPHLGFFPFYTFLLQPLSLRPLPFDALLFQPFLLQPLGLCPFSFKPLMIIRNRCTLCCRRCLLADCLNVFSYHRFFHYGQCVGGYRCKAVSFAGKDGNSGNDKHQKPYQAEQQRLAVCFRRWRRDF